MSGQTTASPPTQLPHCAYFEDRQNLLCVSYHERNHHGECALSAGRLHDVRNEFAVVQVLG